MNCHELSIVYNYYYVCILYTDYNHYYGNSDMYSIANTSY